MFDLHHRSARPFRASVAPINTFAHPGAAATAGLTAQALVLKAFDAQFLNSDPPLALFKSPPKRPCACFSLVYLALPRLIPLAMALDPAARNPVALTGVTP